MGVRVCVCECVCVWQLACGHGLSQSCVKWAPCDVERVRVEPGLTKPGPGAHGLGTTEYLFKYAIWVIYL